MSPRIAVEPADVRPHLAQAVRDGGGEIVPVDEADGLVWTHTDGVDELCRLLAANPHLRWVQVPWAGVEPFFEAGLVDDQRIWTCGKGVYARPVAEHALALALAGLRNLPRRADSRSWGAQGGISLLGGRVTIFGGGGIARALIELLAPFDARVTVVRKHRRPVPGADQVLAFPERYEAIARADVVVLALALTDETRKVMGREEFEVMAPHAWLVNVARGAHVDTGDLVVALRGDIIGGAALDVTDPEPLPDGHPLWSLPNCLITPHTANTEGMAAPLVAARVTDNVRRFGEGRELVGTVDPALGY